MKVLISALVALTVIAFPVAAFSQDAQPASKAVATVSSDLQLAAVVGEPGDPGFEVGPWTTLLSTTMRPADGKDLFITASMQTGLFQFSLADPYAPSLRLTTEGLRVRVLVDGNPVSPGAVTWDRDLNFALLAANISVLDLRLRSGVRAFTFVAPNVGPGVHTIEVQGRFVLASVHAGPAGSLNGAYVGQRTLTVESVRLP